MQESTFTFKESFLSFLAAAILIVLRSTFRWNESGLRNQQGKHWSTGEPVILTFWHNQQLLMPWSYRVKNKAESKNQRLIYVLASMHGDGRLISALLKRLSILNVPGSSTRGGHKAFLDMCRLIKQGNHIAITPDGPRGPAREAKQGVIKLASITGAKILPIAFDASNKWVFNSWDLFFIPKPFSKTYMIAGDKIEIEKNLSKEEIEKQAKILTDVLNELNSKLEDRLMDN